jgi:hypothetical protein
MGLTMKERRALARESANKYRSASKKQKGALLEVFIEQTQYSRRYASWLLRNWGRRVYAWIDGEPIRFMVGVPRGKTPRKRPRVYDQPVRQALRGLWHLFDFMCGKRLAIMIRTTLETLVSSGELTLRPEVMEKLLSVSPATIDRLLSKDRRSLRLRSRSRTKPGTLLKHQIPIRTFHQWEEKKPGFFEIDLVGHDGGIAEGEYAYTLTATDVDSGWTELRPLRNRAQKWATAALEDIRTLSPIPILGIDSDNGSEFINDNTLRWCKDKQITFTRSRPYRTEDTCYVEQKNGAMVRRLVGYQRYDTERELELLAQLYQRARLLENFFYPSMKLKSKTRVGSKVRKRYDAPRSPYQRLLDSPHVSQQNKGLLILQKAELNPAQLKREIAGIQQSLWAIGVAKKKMAPLRYSQSGTNPARLRKTKKRA